MILEHYLNQRLLKRTVAIMFSLTLAVWTQSLVTLLHEINWDYLRVSELFILTMKEGLPSIPIILNLSLVIAWITVKKELYQKKEVNALWLNGWTTDSTRNLILRSLLLVSISNIFILCILAPSVRHIGPSKNTDWIQALSHQNINHLFHVSAAKNKIVIGQGLSEHKIIEPVFIEFDESWHVFRSAYAKIDTDRMNLVDLHSILVPKDLESFTINTVSIPIVESPASIAKEFYSLPELYQQHTPKMMGEMIWRLGLILLPWCVLYPFRSLAPNLWYRKEGSGELLTCLSWLSAFLILTFLGSKLPVLLCKG